MSSASNSGIALAALLIVLACTTLQSARAAEVHASAQSAQLRVCADPNNLPFSNKAEQGFENRLAELVAAELGHTVVYTWWPQRRGFVRNTVHAGACDLVMGIPAQFELLQTTLPYYRSSYVFVTRTADEREIASLDDPALKQLRIGLHTIGDDYSNVPPAQALAMRGIVQNVRGYSIYGDYSQPDPPRVLLDALAAGEIDVAIAWGPLAGYFAQEARVPLKVTPIIAANPQDKLLPMQFEIAMGVRRGDDALEAQLDRIIRKRSSDIEALLVRYGVPLVPRERIARRASGGD